VARGVLFSFPVPLMILAGLLAAAAGAARASESVTLEQAIAEARAANARLPMPAIEIQIAREREREARADRWLKLAIEGDFIYSPESGYDPIVTNLGEERLQIAARQPLLDGGQRRAAVAQAGANRLAAEARYRIAERDVDLEVRTRFAEALAAESEAEARRRGLERLTGYRSLLEGRRRAGQAVSADYLRTQVRVSSEESDLLDAEQRRREALSALNDLMGRDPRAPLELAPLPPPTAPGEESAEPWATAPEVLEARSLALAAQAGVTIAKAERRPHLFATADAGLWGSDTTQLVPQDVEAAHPGATLADRLRRDAGYSVGLDLSWPLWSAGAIDARVAESELALGEARKQEDAQRRRARLEWDQAMDAERSAYRQSDILSRALPTARDSYLEAESRYRGGAGSSLEVLDAFAASVDAEVRLAQAQMRWRIADALAKRWEGSAAP
jgi:outer membrane protein TolC